jgi:predicted RNA-binding protein with PIN domain
MAVDLIIDGYNLLHASGVIGRGIGPGALARSRQALLGVLSASLEPDQRPRTTVVFDSGPAGRGLPHDIEWHGMRVRFAAQHACADALIEELIQANSAPRRLVVVSSDHRLQRAARRRRARAIDSDRWFAQLLAKRRRRQSATPPAETTKPNQRLTPAEVEYWLAQFRGEPESPRPTATDGETEVDNPFPPGYAEDLLDEDDK